MHRFFYRIILSCICIIIYGCSLIPLSLQKEFPDYLPIYTNVEKGLAHKYYVHFRAKGDSETSTTVEYQTFQFSSGKLEIKYFDPALKLKRLRLFESTNTKLNSLLDRRYNKRDTGEYEIIQPIYLNFEKIQEPYLVKNGEKKWERIQEHLLDTTILNRPAKIIEGRQIVTSLASLDTVDVSKFREIYVEGLGLFSLIF